MLLVADKALQIQRKPVLCVFSALVDHVVVAHVVLGETSE